MDRRQCAWAALCIFVLLGVQSSNLSVAAYEFMVGDSRGWSVPSGRDQTDMYNQWAARNRFQIGDTLLFKYNRSSDSVVQVSTAEEYRSCNTSKSLRTFNDGNTVFKLERSGAFYFITGSSGNCRKGLKMILVVITPRNRPGGRAAPAPSPSMAMAPRPQLASSPSPFARNFPVPAPSFASSPTPSINGRVPDASAPSDIPSGSPPAPLTAAPPSTGQTSPPPALSPAVRENSAPNFFWNLPCAGIGLLGLVVFI